MDRKTQVIIGCIAIGLLLGGFGIYMLETSVGPTVMRGAAPGVSIPTPTGWLAFALSLIGSGGFSMTGLILLIRKLIASAPINDSAKLAIDSVVDVGVLSLYAQLYKKSTDPIERSKIREAAAIANQAAFDSMFPVMVSP